MQKNISHSPRADTGFQAGHFPGRYATYMPAPEYHISTSTDSMHPVLNPDKEKINGLVQLSELKAAKWIKDLDTGNLWYWPASWATHANVAVELGIRDYDKGVVI